MCDSKPYSPQNAAVFVWETGGRTASLIYHSFRYTVDQQAQSLLNIFYGVQTQIGKRLQLTSPVLLNNTLVKAQTLQLTETLLQMADAAHLAGQAHLAHGAIFDGTALSR